MMTRNCSSWADTVSWKAVSIASTVRMIECSEPVSVDGAGVGGILLFCLSGIFNVAAVSRSIACGRGRSGRSSGVTLLERYADFTRISALKRFGGVGL